MNSKKALIHKLAILNKCRWCLYGEIKKGKPKCQAPDDFKATCQTYKLKKELYG